MTKPIQTTPTVPSPSVARRTRGLPQFVLAAVMLVFLAIGWRQVDALVMLIELQMVPPAAGLLIFSGAIFLALGAARSLYNAPLGKYCFLVAAAELAFAAPQIGNWEYKVSQTMLATALFGLAIAAAGAWLAHRARKR